ncbi:MAG: hypothetical protein IPJ65_00835 [Archangiaceae bacterium]|nr:hypothetical protein [Archangiaceae bacterium]
MGNKVSGLAALLLASCAVEPQLVPAANAERAGLTRRAATSFAHGVRVFVDATAWQGQPENLSELLLPVRVKVENASGRPVRVAYADFSLSGEKQYRALPLLDSDVQASVRAQSVEYVTPHVARFPASGFYVAPLYAEQYPKLEPWPRALHLNPASKAGVALVAEELPSADMLSYGLPEGVLENAGAITAFVYFPRVGATEKALQFRFELVDPDTMARFGTVAIPLETR